MAVGAALLAGIALTGCGQSQSPEQKFVSDVRTQVTVGSSTSDRELIELGVAMCGARHRGISRASIETAGTDSGFTQRETGVIYDDSVAYLC